MSNASTLLHHFERLADACGVKFDNDARNEIEGIVEDIESEIANLRDDVRELSASINKLRNI